MMRTKLPRVDNVEADSASSLRVTWKGSERSASVDLAGWIASGSDLLAPLRDAEVFRRAAVGEHGAFVTWDDDKGDLAIDAVHLEMIMREQQPFGPEEASAWQKQLGISNSEAAGFLDVSASTWATYKAGSASIPRAVAMLCRATLRDPLPVHACLRPARPTGRPPRAAAR